MFLRVSLQFFLLFCLSFSVIAQKESLFLFSNLDEDIDPVLLELFEKDIKNTDHKVTILSLGDNNVEALKQIKKVSGGAKVKLITGDRDHIDLKSIKKLKKKNDYKLLTDGLYCPDPKVKELDNHNLLIAINSNWFLDRDILFTAKDKDCNTFNEIDFFEELESIIEKNESKNIFIVAHHTIESNTQLNGKNLWPYDLIPLAGNLYASYRRNIGRTQDMTSDRYEYYAKRMNELDDYYNVNVITGHDKVNAIYTKENLRSINLNSGNENYPIKSNAAHAVYQSRLPSYIKLDINDKISQLIIVNEIGRDSTFIIPKRNITAISSNTEIEKIIAVQPVAASKKYNSNKFKNWLMGSGYRKAWSTPVAAPPLIIQDQKLSPYARGGGLQTQSVKFKNPENKKFAFRALDKEPEKSLNDILQKSVYKKVVQELITTMHPYGPLVAHELIKETDIIHIEPKLYTLAAGQKAMKNYSEFENKIGTLEEKPKGKSKKREGYMGADEVVSSYQMLADIISDSDHRIDKQAYARARVFDMYIGDWDRHEDNWKWAMYDNYNQRIYKPIPKDRDHVFSKWTGLIPKISDYFIANAEHFGEEFGNLKQLNFKAYHLDRQLGTELTAEDWQAAVDYINSKMTDKVIEESVKAFPQEVRALYDEEIITKLESRRHDLARAVHDHYCNISREVNAVGSNKRDYFQIKRHNNGDVTVKIYKSNKEREKKELYFDRTFKSDITKVIYCYGLDGEDIFDLKGTVDKSIKIRIIGGDDKDYITDHSSVNGRFKSTQIYDSDGEDDISDLMNEVKIKKPSRKAYYEPYASAQNSFLPLPSIRKSSGNGWGIDLGIQYVIQGYNKPNFAKYYTANIRYYPQIGAYRVDGSFRYRHVIGLSDFITKLTVSDEYDKFPFLYGIGSNTTFDEEGREDGLYRLDYDYGRYDIGLVKSFFDKSQIENTAFIEYHGIDAEENSGILESDLPQNTKFLGYKSELKLDLTDRSKYPLDGNKMHVKLEGRISENKIATANLQSEISYYKTIKTGFTTTIAANFGYQVSYGDVNFYHLSSLGSNVGLRGYTRNRFLDKYATYYNTELRWKLGTLQTPIIQMEVGTFLLHDNGKVWNDISRFGQNEWKSSYGVGIFLAPYSTDYAISYSLIRSEDEIWYSQFQLGFNF